MFFSLAVFKNAPPYPPSAAQLVQRNVESNEHFLPSLKRLFTNVGYILLLVSYAINVGIFYAISTLLNQVILAYYPVSVWNNFLSLSLLFLYYFEWTFGSAVLPLMHALLLFPICNVTFGANVVKNVHFTCWLDKNFFIT